MGQIALQRDPVNSVRIGLIFYTLGINWYYQMFLLTDTGNSEKLFLGGSKITADGDCSQEIKRRLLLGRKVMTNLVSILKSRDIILPAKVLSSQGYGFFSGHVWM